MLISKAEVSRVRVDVEKKGFFQKNEQIGGARSSKDESGIFEPP